MYLVHENSSIGTGDRRNDDKLKEALRKEPPRILSALDRTDCRTTPYSIRFLAPERLPTSYNIRPGESNGAPFLWCSCGGLDAPSRRVTCAVVGEWRLAFAGAYIDDYRSFCSAHRCEEVTC